ncbi:MAG: asparagine synthase (glutamine-hydrolyzing) [Betaproteobacteria bacterium]
MCGIAGIVNLGSSGPPPDIEALDRMAASLRHRGPDGSGVYRDAAAGLSHARLAIIDLERGQQPLSNEDGTLWIVFNGEIFNYVELRRELEEAGHRFRSHSDTEVIVHAYEQWREAAFSRFNGQWSAALWDASRRTLVLARDPFGVRPLYVARRGGRLYFASEIRAILVGDPELPRRFDPVGLDQTFTFWTTIAPRTVFEGIEEVEPGCVRTYSNGRVAETSCCRPDFPEGTDGAFAGSMDDAVVAVRAALAEATRLRMLRSDVPVGSYLSGGLDSSLIAALALRARGRRFCTFSLGFDDADYDETPYQRAMARYLGSDHREVRVSKSDIARVFPEVIAHTERPVLRTAPAPLFLLSRHVQKAGIKVVLTGEGADELFGGYDLFREAKVRRFWAREPASVRRPALLQRLYPYLGRSPAGNGAISRQFFGQRLDAWARPGFGHDLRWRSTGSLKRLFSRDLSSRLSGADVVADLLGDLPGAFSRWTYLAQDQYLEIRTLLSGYLLASQGDRMLMAHSIEGRFPFLDRNVARLADSLPAAAKLRVLDEKHVLKRASSGLVPSLIRERKKQPYRAPDALALVQPEAREWIEHVADLRSLGEAGVFDAAAGRRLIEKCLAATPSTQFSNADNMGLVGLLSTQLLYDQYIRQRPATPPALPYTRRVDQLSQLADVKS